MTGSHTTGSSAGHGGPILNPNVVLEANGLSKSYPSPAGRLEVLRSVDLVVTRGTILAVLGASGSGKSTLLNIL